MIIRYCVFMVCTFYLVYIFACQKGTTAANENQPLFDSIPTSAMLNPIIAEASGIADSKKNIGYLWVEEDSGNPSQIYLVNHNGKVSKKVFIKSAVNRDWEDMTLSNGKIYIAETGDNNEVYTDYAFYAFNEPDQSTDTIYNFEKISFRYPDGSHDAEAFLVEQTTGNIYIITKRDNPSRIYKLTAPFSASMQTASLVGQLNYNFVTSAALSSDGKEVVVKNYGSIFYYKLNSGETIESIAKKNPVLLPYQLEPQGEAICFAADDSGYFTLSEKALGIDPQLYFYKRHQ